MSIANTEKLFLLIKSLTKAEKRAFNLYVNRNQSEGNSLSMQLFDTLDKQKTFDDAALKLRFKGKTKASFSNLKSHLFEQIMISLRLIHKDKKQNIKIREYIDFAHLLYGKGLHIHALSILAKARKLSIKHHNDFSLLTIIELEKMIHSRHITRTQPDKIKNLIQESESLSNKISGRIKLSNVRIQLHNIYVEKGHVSNEVEQNKLEGFFLNRIKNFQESALNGMELIYFYQSHVWFYYILDNFKQCIIYAKKWVELFKRSVELQSRDIDLYMRGYHYVLTSAFHLKDTVTFKIYLEELELMRKNMYSKLNINSQIVSFQYVHNGRMNLHFLEGTFEKGIKNIPNTLNRVRRYQNKLDTHKVMIIYYKVSWMYIGNGEVKKAIKYIQSIINSTEKSLRIDIQCYSRLMLLLAFYELDDYYNFDQHYKETKRFFKSSQLTNKIQLLILEMLNKTMAKGEFDRKPLLTQYYDEFLSLKNSRFERRSFIYLDILPWIYSKIKKVSLGQAIKLLS